MTTPIHLIFDLTIYYGINLSNIIPNQNITDMVFLFSAELIDLDHLFSKPIYHPTRNPFKTHFLHKKWPIILLLAIFLLFFRNTLFFGIWLLSHLFVDYCYVKIYCSKK